MKSKFSLSRRTFLRGSAGAGVACVGLPLLEAMLNSNGTALAGGAALPKQFITYFIGNGFRLDKFEPAQTGVDFTLSEELAPLSNVQSYLKVVTGLQNWCAHQPTHHEGMTGFNGYTMVGLNGLESYAGGPTIDQVIADHIQSTLDQPLLVSSVQAGISRRLSTMDQGFTMHAVSHRSANQPLAPEFNPQEIWKTLFFAFEPKPDDSALRLMVVDAIREDALKLQARLGTADRQRLEAHLDGLNELEQRILTMPPECIAPTMPTETNPETTGVEPLMEVNELMCDLIVEALKCDVTRVASIMFVGGAAETSFGQIGQSTAHHMNTHDQFAQDQVHEGVVYAMGRVAYLAEKMQTAIDPRGKNLLETGLIMLSSDCAVGFTHEVSRQPYVLIGNLNGNLVEKYHYQSTPRSTTQHGAYQKHIASGNTSDVLFTILKCFNPDATSVGDMTPGDLDGNAWFGTTNPPGFAAPGSNQIIPALTGPNFGT